MGSISFDKAVRSKLPPKYQVALLVLPFGLMCGSLVPSWFFADALAHTLGILMHAPVRDQPHGILWLVLFLAVMDLLAFVGLSLGSLLNVLILRRILGWSWVRIREAGVCFPRMLADWFEGQSLSLKGSENSGQDEDPLYDSQFDESV
jgi:hypothetical protein